MTTYQKTNAAADSTQEAMKVRYNAKTYTSGGRRAGVFATVWPEKEHIVRRLGSPSIGLSGDVYCRDGRVQ